MARSKRFTPKRRSRASRTAPGRARRFFRSLLVSALVSFSAASCVFNPQLRDPASVAPILAQLGIGAYAPSESPAPPASEARHGESTQLRFSDCPQFFPGGRAPMVPAGQALRELCYSSFAILHSGQTRTPVFVAQRLNRRMLAQAREVGRTDSFYPEARLPAAERAELGDYRNSGYSRGHMAPAGDMHTPEAMAQSFSLANMVPQDQRHNAGAWNKIENDTRKYILRAKGDVYVFTGPVYGAKTEFIGNGRVAVPTHLFKLVHDATTGRTWAHWQANHPDARAGAPISHEEFVRRTGVRVLGAG